jgi:hypothetical protein
MRGTAGKLIVFGYVRLVGVLRHAIPGLEALFERNLPSARAQGLDRRRSRFINPSENRGFAKAITEGAVGQLMREVRADNVILEECNILVGDSHWHRDGARVPSIAYRIAVYLDPIRDEYGALSVIPSSHLATSVWTPDLLSSLPESARASAETAQPLPSTKLISDPGDVIIFHSSLIHASFGGGYRRQIALVAVGEPNTPGQKAELAQFFLNRYVGSSIIFDSVGDANG